MAKISLSKTIEAKKLNKRTGLAESGPDATIPFGALVEHVETVRDTVKFLYMGDTYRCPEDTWLSAVRDNAAAKPARDAGPAETPATAANGPSLTFQTLASGQYRVARAKVPGGWLVMLEGHGVTFYPDASHEWDGGSPA